MSISFVLVLYPSSKDPMTTCGDFVRISLRSYRLGDRQQLVTLSLSTVWYCYVLDYLMACIK
ncbi:hypothetical protein ES288_D03G068000v1 [Gossypium darwinii]|uniref:Uncharacterized protein n=1 Tax=Gossypium darwinii TaxID=34276 RepID=A0A5D2D4M8_GOSDA|nr:hypothetical protein ES288_D03G068000v1 [Gossypium darwinii]